MTDTINLAVASTVCRIGDLAHNLAQIDDFARQAAAADVHLLLTPEMSATGYGPYPENLALAEIPGDGPVYRGLSATARRSGVIIAAGFVEQHPHGPGISHYLVCPDGQFVVQRKYRVTPAEAPLVSALPRLKSGDEPPAALPFSELEFPVLPVRGLRAVLAICCDAGLDGLQDHFDRLGAQIFLGPSGAGGDVSERVRAADLHSAAGRAKYRAALAKAYFPPADCVWDCVSRRRAAAAVNQTGWDGRRFAHIGDGFVISPRGEMPALMSGTPNLDYQRPEMRVARIPLEQFGR